MTIKNSDSDSYASTIANIPKNSKLEVLSGPMDGLIFTIQEDSIIIGREKDQDISLPLDILISRSHARITYEEERYWLEDLGSKNGTLLNKKLVNDKVVVPLGAIFKIGLSEMRLI